MRPEWSAQPTGLVERRLAVLRHIDAETHAAVCRALPELDREVDRAALVDLVAQVAAEAPDAARALASRLIHLSDALADPMALRKWALHGLQRHREDAKARHQFFEGHDPLAFADHRTEDDSAHLLARRGALSHYLAGFGFAAHRIDLLEPQATALPAPALVISNESIRFPRRTAEVPVAQRGAWQRAALAHAAAHLQHSPLGRPAGNRQPMLLAMMALVEDARVERLMVRVHPGLHGLWSLFHTATRETAGFDYAGLAARLARALHDPEYADSNPWVQKGRSAFEHAAATNLHDLAEFDSLARLLAIDMEKMRQKLPLFYRPQPAYRDDNTLLWNFNAALPEDETRTIVREDFELRPDEKTPPDLRPVEVDTRRRTRYPEWDHQLQALRPDWVTVIEPASRPVRDAAARAMRQPRVQLRGLARTPDRAVRRTRQAEGDELDLNAAVDNLIQLRAGIAPDGRVFQRHGRRRRSTAVVLLMDLSESTKRYVPGSFTPVLEVEKRAATLVAESLDIALDRIAVHGFSSNGRHEVHYERIKEFDEAFDAEPRRRMAGLESGLSTRMGAALRHAAEALSRETTDHKLILLLTDGEPSDVDVFDDEHLVEDARHAVAWATGQGVRSFCVTLDRHADGYVRRIFGARNYLIANRADAFAGHAGQTLVRLVAH
jgi:nitric oxide reductase NorD protein